MLEYSDDRSVVATSKHDKHPWEAGRVGYSLYAELQGDGVWERTTAGPATSAAAAREGSRPEARIYRARGTGAIDSVAASAARRSASIFGTSTVES